MTPAVFGWRLIAVRVWHVKHHDAAQVSSRVESAILAELGQGGEPRG